MFPLIACVEKPVLTYEESAVQLSKILDSGALAVFESGVEPTISSEDFLCLDAQGVSDELAQNTRRYNSSMDLLKIDEEEAPARVLKVWREMGLKTLDHDAEDTRTIYASRDGFGVSALFNFGTRMVIVEGSGPCLEPPPGADLF